jgi:hypothetical protein
MGVSCVNHRNNNLYNNIGKNNMNKIKTWILDQFGLVDAYKRIVELERVVIGNKEWIDRHEGNLMILHKNVKALELELDILRKRSEK